MWYCFKRMRPYDPPYGLVIGRWYEETRLAAIEHAIETAYLRVGDEEVPIPLRDLIVRETMADYSYAYNVGSMPRIEPGEPVPPDMLWVPVCPEGHRGPTTPTSPPGEHECSECEITYPVQLEDSGLVLEG